jgi:hypothetical protein
VCVGIEHRRRVPADRRKRHHLDIGLGVEHGQRAGELGIGAAELVERGSFVDVAGAAHRLEIAAEVREGVRLARKLRDGDAHHAAPGPSP